MSSRKLTKEEKKAERRRKKELEKKRKEAKKKTDAPAKGKRRFSFLRKKSGESELVAPSNLQNSSKIEKKKYGRRPRGFKEKEFHACLQKVMDNQLTGVLNLAGKHLDKFAAEELEEVLGKNNTIDTLNLAHNHLEHAGVKRIAAMLEKNKSITELDLTFNRLTKDSLRVLYRTLCNNVYIVNLFMAEEDMPLDAVFGVAVATDTANPITGKYLKRIEDILEENNRFRELLNGRSQTLDLKYRRQAYVNLRLLMRFPNLVEINLSHNVLKTIPEEIRQLKCLEILKLNSNKIDSLPLSFGELKHLRNLEIADNLLTYYSIPLSLMTLPELEFLDFQNNLLKNIAFCSLASMAKLKVLKLCGNDLNEMDIYGPVLADLIKRDVTGTNVLAYFRAAKEGVADVFRMKLMFVGNGNVGKTSLLSNFTTSSRKETLLQVPGQEVVGPVKQAGPLGNVATDGIDIRNWSVPITDTISKEHAGKNIIFSTWDFAGQEVYYATHGFFISHSSLYLIIFDITRSDEESRVEYWLQSIHSRTDTAPVILIATHLENPMCTQQYVDTYFKQLLKKYGRRFKANLVGYFAVSNTTKKGINELKQKILQLAVKQPQMPYKLPLSFTALEEQLLAVQQTTNPPVLNYAKYREIAESCGVHENNLGWATRFLHNLGTLINFEEKGLKDLIIVDPQWLTKVFASVVSLKYTRAFIKNGLLNAKDLPQMWKEYPDDLHPVLVNILEQFGIMARVNVESLPHILVPSLLEDRPPNAEVLDRDWPPLADEPGEIAGRMYHFEFLPLGFFSKIIVNFLKQATQYTTDTEHWWKNGMVLMNGEAKIKIRQYRDPNNKEKSVCLELWVRGPVASNDLRILTESIDTLVKEWLAIPYEVTIPCIHCVRLDSPYPYLFPINIVKQAVTDGLEVVNCSGINAVTLTSLAPDIAMADFAGLLRDYGDIEIMKQIGEGGFAKVHKGILDTEVVAVKELILESEDSANDFGEDSISNLDILDEFRYEVSLMSQMIHPNIVGLKGVVMKPFCMILEFMCLGSLYDYIHDKSKNLNWSVKLKIARDMAEGMKFMHGFKPGQPIVHRDLKSPNVLLTVELDKNAPMIIAKVADFGLSRNLMVAPKLKNKVVDNPVWLAPEMIRRQPYDAKVDVYSYGVILWELTSRVDFLGEITFLSAIEDAVLNGKRPEIPADCTKLVPQFKKLIEVCWAADPDVRPSFPECCKTLAALEAPIAKLRDHKMPDFSSYLVSYTPTKKTSLPKRKVDVAPRPPIQPIAITQAGAPPRRHAATVTPTSLSTAPRSNPPARKHTATNPRQQVKSTGALRSVGNTAADLFTATSLIPCSAAVTVLSLVDDTVWSGCEDGVGYIWDTATGELVKRLRMHERQVLAICFVKGGEVWSLCEDEIKVWSKTGEFVARVPSKGKTRCILDIPENKEATKSSRNTVWVGAEELDKKKKKLRGKILIYDCSTRKLKKTLQLVAPERVLEEDHTFVPPAPRAMLFHGAHVWAASSTIIFCFEPNSLVSKGYLEGHTKIIRQLASFGKEIWSCGDDKDIKVWNPEEKGSNVVYTLQGHLGHVTGICSDGKSRVWSCGWGKQLLMWDLDSHVFIHWLRERHSNHINSVLAVPGRELAIWSGGMDKLIFIWKFKNPEHS